MGEFLGLAWEIARDTTAYLFAYWLVPVWAFLGQVLLYRLAARRSFVPWLESRRAWRRLAAAAGLGIARPFWRPVLARHLEALADRPAELACYLTAGHALTLYYLALLGPLLGKDVLLSHLIGAAVFVPVAGVLARWTGAAGHRRGAPPASSSGDEDTTPFRDGSPPAHPRGDGFPAHPAYPSRFFGLAAGELRRVVPAALCGLAIGSLLGAWGLTGRAFVPAQLGLTSAPTQAINALLGFTISMIAWMWPVSNLFVGTYLWKVGLAHAGLVAFFYAVTVSPQRVRLYARTLGRHRAVRLAMALGAAALIAGAVTAFAFGAVGLEIRYKLVPAQMWNLG